MKLKKLVLSLVVTGSFITGFADAPVVDLSQTVTTNPTTTQSNAGMSGNSSTDFSNLSTDQRLRRLEQQMSNMTQMNSASRLDQMQQQMQQMQGELDTQAHQLQTLQTQQKSFYEDITNQLNQLKTGPINTSTTGKVSANTVSAPNSASEQTTYQNAFNLLAAKKYSAAAQGLQNYLKQYPQGQYAANAHYWLGEVYSMQNQSAQAEKEFQTVVQNYPKDSKVSDALFKLALIHDAAGKHAQAKQELQKIIANYKGTAAAQLATLRLKTLTAN